MNNWNIAGWLIGIVLFFSIIMPIFCGTCGTASKMIENGQQTIYNQFKPEELLRKYEWFKDASAQLDQKQATLIAYEQRFSNISLSYGKDSTNRHKWDKEDREQWNVWESEYLGIKASYNDLASEYNSAMSKFNYAFCNAGKMPEGTTNPLPREYKPYITY